jgi:DNA-directed RNA polymerase specialized sigma24 family protein
MSSSGDVTHWVRQLAVGDREVVQRLWERYYRGLVGLARKKLGALPRRAADEEDVALSAFDSFIRGAEQGRFPRLEDRDDLWQILVMITTRKAIDLAAHEGRDMRDWRRVQVRPEGDADDSGSVMRDLIGREPDPAFAAEVAEQCRHLLARLPDDELRQIALGKLEGCTNEEVAARCDLALATVERRLRIIRKHWASESTSAVTEE